MSKVIDERVVEMRFDNKDFESNVQTSLKTIDKLKDSLNFDESTKSVEKFQDSLKHFSLDDIGNAVESLSNKFNWGNIFKMDLLNNVTEQIYSTITGVFGRIKGALGLENIDPVSNMLEGWQKYADKTQSVATIMAATGESMEVVNEQMERLLYFTDETSYSFTDMTDNIGKFTANGIELEDASTAMQGIATWAARSGQNAQTASRVMYNLAQAIGMGALKLQDWKSVELANMGTKEFKELAIQVGLTTGALIRNAEGIAVINDETANTTKETAVSIENFRETLKDGWLDNETLMETLKEYGKAAELINDINEQTGMYASEIIELARETSAGGLKLTDFAKKLGITEEELKNNKDAVVELKQAFELLGSEEYEFSLATYEAAQEARTFGDAMKSVADAVSSGWMSTFELLFGGYDRAKVLWTDLAVNLSEIFRAATDDRNAILTEANFSGFDKFLQSLDAANVNIEDLKGSMQEIMHAGQFRALMGDAESFEEAVRRGRFSTEQLSKAIENLPDQFKVIKEVAGEAVDNFEEMTEWSWELRKGMYGYIGHDDQVQKLMEAKKITKEYAEQVVSLSEKHEALGRELTREEAAEYLTYTELTNRLEETVNLTDAERDAIKATLAELDKKGAQESFVNGLMNVGHIALETFTTVREAIGEMFPPITAEKLRDLANNFERITGKVLTFITESNALHNVLIALIFPFRVLADVIGVVFKLIAPLGKIVLAILTPIGLALDAFGKWIENIRERTGQLEPFSNVINKIGDALEVVLEFLGKVGAKLVEIAKLKIGDRITNPFQNLANVIERFSSKSIKRIDEFIEKIKNANIDKIANNIIDTLRSAYNTIKSVFAPVIEYINKARATVEVFARDFMSRFERIGRMRAVYNNIKLLDQAFYALKGTLNYFGITSTPTLDTIYKFLVKISNKFDELKLRVGVFVKDFVDRFKMLGVVDKDMGLIERAFLALRGTLDSFGIGIEGFIQKLKSAKQAVIDFFTGLKGASDVEQSPFTSLIQSIGEALPKVAAGGGLALAGAGIFNFIKSLKEAKKNDSKGIIDKIFDALNPLPDLFDKLETATSSFNIKNFAVSMAILAGALIALSFVPAEKLSMSLGTLGTSLAGFIATIAAVNKIMGDKGTFRLIGIGAGMILIAGSLLLFATAINKFKNIDIGSNSDILKIFGGLLLAVTSMSRLSKAAGKSNFRFSGGLALVATALALLEFAKVIEAYNKLDVDRKNVVKIFGSLATAITSMIFISKTAGKHGFKLSNGLGLIALATSLLIFANVVTALGNIPDDILKKGLLALAGLSLIVAAMAELLGIAAADVKLSSAVGTFIMLAGMIPAVIAFGIVAAGLGMIPADKVWGGIYALAAIMGMMALMMKGLETITKDINIKKALAVFIEMTAVVLAVTAFGALCAILGAMSPVIALGLLMLAAIIGEISWVLSILNTLVNGKNMKGILIGVAAIGLFGLSLIPMVKALTELGKLDFKTTQQNLILIGELLLAFVGLIGIATIVGLLAKFAGPILLVGIGIVAGVFALFVGAIAVLVKDLERLAAIDAESAKAGLELVKEELNILTDLAREFQENSGLFTASLGAAFVCLEFGKGLHELADDTLILGLANASRASESLKVVKEEIALMIELGDYLAQNEGAFGKAITASAAAFSFGIGLHGLANDTRILGLTNAENAKAALEPMNDLIGIMLGLAETIGTDPGLFVKALVTSADMIAFGIGLLPLVGVEFLAGLADAPTVVANMTQLTGLIDSLFGLAEKVGEDASLYFGAKATAEAIKDFGYALLPLIASEFLSQFVDADASTAGFEATKKVVQWLLDIAGYFQGADSINLGAGAAVDRLNGFAKSLAKLTAVDFFSQFVSAENALEGLKPVQTVVDMLVGMVTSLSATEGMAETAKTAVEAVKTFAGSLTDIMWSLNSGSYSGTDTTSITTVIGAVTDGITQLASVGGNMANVSLALEGIGDIFESLGSLGTKGGIFGKKSFDTSGITVAFDAIGESITSLSNTIVQQDIGNKILETIVNPITSGVNTATTAVASLAQAMSDTVATFETAFQVDGNNLAVGMINGIYSRVQDAYDAGYQLGSDAERGVRDAGDINSPSKVFEKLGGYLGEGFVEGIESKYSQVTDAARLMTQHAIDMASELKERVKKYLADKENEFVLTPVLDMDGVSKIGRLMSNMQGSSSYVTNHMNSAAVESSIKSKNVMPELQTLQDQIALLGEHMDNLQVVLDTGTLVGATSAKMDSQFGIMSMRRGRGN